MPVKSLFSVGSLRFAFAKLRQIHTHTSTHCKPPTVLPCSRCLVYTGPTGPATVFVLPPSVCDPPSTIYIFPHSPHFAICALRRRPGRTHGEVRLSECRRNQKFNSFSTHRRAAERIQQIGCNEPYLMFAIRWPLSCQLANTRKVNS